MDDIKENMNYSVLYHNNTALCTSESYGQVLQGVPKKHRL